MRITAWATGSRPHPVTGDALTASDRIDWYVQGLIRRRAFLVVFLAITFVWWAHPAWFGDGADRAHWNLAASALAIVVEGIVGRAMFGQTMRDAVEIRNDLHTDRDTNTVVHAIAAKLEVQITPTEEP